MRKLSKSIITDAVAELCVKAAHVLPQDVATALEQALESETHPGAREILRQLLENARIAATEQYPLCQDTGLAVVFADQGMHLQIVEEDGKRPADLSEAINAGVAKGYEAGLLRKSVVADPLGERKNTGTNTPAIVHRRLVSGDQLRISVMLKGGGCENRSRFRMLKPADGAGGVEDFIVETVAQAGADACPPFVVGVGIGGDFEKCCELSKRALLRPLGSRHRDACYADMEHRLLERINSLGVGPQGMGGKTTALAVLIETHPCHIASLPVAVNIECHSHRHFSEVL